MVATPLAVGVGPGQTVRVVVRGKHLERAEVVRIDPPIAGLRATVASQGIKSPPPPGQTPEESGDTELAVALAFEAGAEAVSDPQSVRLFMGGEDVGGAPCRLLICPPGVVTVESIESKGFGDAPGVGIPAVVAGAIGHDRETDVFRILGEPGVPFSVTLEGPSAGSAIDPVLVVYDGRMRPVARVGGSGTRRSDRTISIRRPSGDGTYHVLVADAGDRGGPAHPYVLVTKPLQGNHRGAP